MSQEEAKPKRSRKGLRDWWRLQLRQLVGPPKSRDELLEWLRDGRQAELLDTEAYGMIQGVLQVSRTQVRDIMVPRSQMVVVERDTSPTELLREVIHAGHSRYPVIGDNRDEVVGILLAKDLLRLAMDQEHLTPESRFDIGEVIRPAVVVPESKRLNILLKEFRANRNHIAIVLDEYGGVSGLVTIEDVLEQIVGEIDDEHDEEEGAFILRQDRERYLVRALTPIEEFNRYFGSQFGDEEFDTIGGLVAHRFGHLPRRGESVTVERFQFNVQRADSRRVHLFQVTVHTDSGSAAA
jgi:magnesium and cobalt transporter